MDRARTQEFREIRCRWRRCGSDTFFRRPDGRLERIQRDNRHGGMGRTKRKGRSVSVLEDGQYVYDYSLGYAGYHGLQHETVIEHRAPHHPILQGLPPQWKHFKDEIYTRLRGPVRNMEILATAYERGRHEPLMWTVSYGKGRIFVDLLGHCGNDPNMTYSMRCTGFQVTLLRGCEWAATGAVTQEVPADFPLKDTYTLRPEFKAPFHAYPKTKH